MEHFFGQIEFLQGKMQSLEFSMECFVGGQIESL